MNIRLKFLLFISRPTPFLASNKRSCAPRYLYFLLIDEYYQHRPSVDVSDRSNLA